MCASQEVYTFQLCSLFHIHQHVLLLFCSHCVPQDGITALMLASYLGRTDNVRVLVTAGVQVDLQDEVRCSICVLW